MTCGSVVKAVEWLCNHGCVVMAVGSWLWNPGGGDLAVESWLWNSGCGILAVATLLAPGQWLPGKGLQDMDS